MHYRCNGAAFELVRRHFGSRVAVFPCRLLLVFEHLDNLVAYGLCPGFQKYATLSVFAHRIIAMGDAYVSHLEALNPMPFTREEIDKAIATVRTSDSEAC